MHPAYVRMNHELAPYQGFPSHEPRPVGDPSAGRPGGEMTLSVDAAGVDEVLQSRRQIGNPAGVALAEASGFAGGFLLPPVTR